MLTADRQEVHTWFSVVPKRRFSSSAAEPPLYKMAKIYQGDQVSLCRGGRDAGYRPSWLRVFRG